MVEELITEDEIKKLKTKPRILSWKDIVVGGGFKEPIRPIELSSGYRAGYSIDAPFPDSKIIMEHVSVSMSAKRSQKAGFIQKPDPADLDTIASKVLGDGYKDIGIFFLTDVCHYMKPALVYRQLFTRVEVDADHYYYAFKTEAQSGKFEVCLEPCIAGFDVAIYDISHIEHPEIILPPEEYKLLEDKICTKSSTYLDIDSMLGMRSDEDWTIALVIASNLLRKYAPLDKPMSVVRRP